FAAALRRVLDDADAQRLAVMCSETLWWRCHRRLISDALTLLPHIGAPEVLPFSGKVTVLHVDGRGELEPHRVTPEAHREGQILVYR
ncbi:MAG: DUF488 domain-containing protein, partial [Candidatus Dormibacteraeota bacterium]|nr:DUF488 domain-containing protein [Candidatus Dormibacteraeota bacterium]